MAHHHLLQRRSARIFDSQAHIDQAATHNGYVVQHPEKINEWSDALKILVTQGTFRGDDETRSALACECMVRGEGQILSRLLVGATTLTLKGVIERNGLDTLLEAIPEEGGPTSLALSGVSLDQDGCHSLLLVLVKSGATSLSLDVRLPMGLYLVCHSELLLTSLEVTTAHNYGCVSELVMPLIAHSPFLDKVTILVGEQWSARALLQIEDALFKHGRVRNLEVLLPSSDTASCMSLHWLLAALSQPSLNSLTIVCEAPGNPDIRICRELGDALITNPNLREISLRGWTRNCKEAHDAFDKLLDGLVGLENLVKLDVRDNLGIGKRQKTFTTIGGMHNLQLVDLKGTADTLSYWIFLFFLLRGAPNLTHLALPDLDKDFDVPTLAEIVRSHTSLRHLDVRYINPDKPDNEKAYLEIMTICSRRNQPAYQQLLSQRLVEAISGYMAVGQHTDPPVSPAAAGARRRCECHGTGREIKRQADSGQQADATGCPRSGGGMGAAAT